MNNEQKLPYCEYPKAKDIASHGLQELPSILPSIDWGKVNRYRNVNFHRSYVSLLDYDEILESAHLVAKSFAKNEAMRRTLKLRGLCLMNLRHIHILMSLEEGE